MFQNQIGNNKGISIIELLVVIAILGVGLTGLLGLANFSLKSSVLIRGTTQAVGLSQEALEAVRSIRDQDWTKITNGNHGITSAGGQWDFIGSENVINGFTRTLFIEDVQRNNDDIVESGGTNDPDTKKATAIVSWTERGEIRQIKIVTYLTNWQQ